MISPRKKVLLDIFGYPLVLFPSVVGISSLILSWAVGGSSFLTFLGLTGLLIGVGGFATRIASCGDLLVKQREYETEEQVAQMEDRLNILEKKLACDPQTRACMREIRQTYGGFKKEEMLLDSTSQEVYKSVGELFQACVAQLEQISDLRDAARNLSTNNRNRTPIEQEAARLTEEVLVTAAHLSDSIQRFRLWKANKKRKDLTKLRKQLDNQMETARQVERKMAAFSGDADETSKEFDAFVKEAKQ